MTKAEAMRKITEQITKRQLKTVAENRVAYVDKLMDTKIRRRALKGYCNCTIKLRKHESVALVNGLFIDNGFTTQLGSKNGRQYIKVEW